MIGISKTGWIGGENEGPKTAQTDRQKMMEVLKQVKTFDKKLGNSETGQIGES